MNSLQQASLNFWWKFETPWLSTSFLIYLIRSSTVSVDMKRLQLSSNKLHWSEYLYAENLNPFQIWIFISGCGNMGSSWSKKLDERPSWTIPVSDIASLTIRFKIWHIEMQVDLSLFWISAVFMTNSPYLSMTSTTFFPRIELSIMRVSSSRFSVQMLKPDVKNLPTNYWIFFCFWETILCISNGEHWRVLHPASWSNMFLSNLSGY